MTPDRQTPAASKRPAPLPEAELDVLARLHELGEAEASEIRSRLEPIRPLSHASVMTLLTRLEAKGLVTRRKADRGKAFVFSATRSPEETHQNVVGRVLERVFLDDPVALVSSLFGARPPSAEELDRMAQIVESMQENSADDDPEDRSG